MTTDLITSSSTRLPKAVPVHCVRSSSHYPVERSCIAAAAARFRPELFASVFTSLPGYFDHGVLEEVGTFLFIMPAVINIADRL